MKWHNLDDGSAISCSIRGGLACCYGQGLPSAHHVHFQCEECAQTGGACVARGIEYQCFARSGSGLSNWSGVWFPGTDKAHHGGSDRSHLDSLCHGLLRIGINSHLTQFGPTSAEMGPSCLGSARIFPDSSARAPEVVQGISNPYPHDTHLVSAMWVLVQRHPRVILTMCSPTSSASMEEATTSIATLTDLVHRVLQRSQEMSSRLSSLEGLLQAQTEASSHSSNERDEEDDVSTIIPRRPMHETIMGTVDVENVRSVFDFDHDLHGSRVYVRALRRESLRSLRSDSRSFGWSCLSGLSMADVSNISVVSLPICGAELTNSEHYNLTETCEHRASRSLSPQLDTMMQQGFQPPTVASQALKDFTPEANIFLWGG